MQNHAARRMPINAENPFQMSQTHIGKGYFYLISPSHYPEHHPKIQIASYQWLFRFRA